MEAHTKEQVSKDEEFDFWSFQAHECGVGETIKINYYRSESLEREGIFVQETIVEPKDLKSNTFKATTHSPGWKEYLSQMKSNSSRTIARLQVCISGLIFFIVVA